MWTYDPIMNQDVYKPELAGKTPLEVLAVFGMRGRVILGGVEVPEQAYNAPQGGMVDIFTLVAGDSFREQLDSAAGEHIDFNTPVIDTNIYVPPTWKAYGLKSNAVLVLIDKSQGYLAYHFESVSAFRKWKDARGMEYVKSADGRQEPTPPTERELNELYLAAQGWTLQAKACGESVWTDPLTETDYFFASALDIQEGRDMLDGADDLRASLRSENGERAEMDGDDDETPLGELYGGE